MNDYNEKNCDERHEFVEKEFEKVWKKLDKYDIRIWGILVLQITIIALIVKLS